MSESPKIPVKNYLDASKLKVDTQIPMADLSNAMAQQASLRLHYGELSTRAAKQLDDLELLLEVTSGKLWRQILDTAAADTEKKKPTDKTIENEIATHPKVIALKRAINEAKQIAAYGKVVDKAWEDRKDMLIQIGAKDRKEMEGELRVKVAEAASGAGDRLLARQKTLRGEVA